MRDFMHWAGRVARASGAALPWRRQITNDRAGRALLADLASRADYLLADIGLCREDLLRVEGRPDASLALQDLVLLRNTAAAARTGREAERRPPAIARRAA